MDKAKRWLSRMSHFCAYGQKQICLRNFETDKKRSFRKLRFIVKFEGNSTYIIRG